MSKRSLRARVRARNGFGDLPHRLREEPCRIAYLGASVTAQRDGYRMRLHELLCSWTAQAHLSIHAGTGGVGSLSGVFLMDTLVLAHEPQLCFVEYATNDLDGRTSPALTGRAVEGIVGKLRERGCQPCFLYLYRRDTCFGRANEVIAAHEAVADYHRVPSIDVAAPIEEGATRGELRVDELLRDVVHTTPAGSRLVAESILDAVQQISAASAITSPPHGELHLDGFRGARVYPARRGWLKHQARAERKRFRLTFEYLRIGSDNHFTCTFDGELVGMVVIVGPTSGIIRVSAGQDVREITLWDPHCHYERLSTVIFPRRYSPGCEVRIEPTEAGIDYSSSLRPVDHRATISKDLKVVGFMVRA